MLRRRERLAPGLACACVLALVLTASAGAARIRVGGCTLFDFGGPGAAVPGKTGRYDASGFWYDGSNGWMRQQQAPGRISVDPAVKLVRGMKTVRLEVRPGDRQGMLGERADVYYGGTSDPSPPGGVGATEGATQWWAWSTRTDPGYRPGATWNALMDFHNNGTAPSANVTVSVLGSNVVFDAYGGSPTDPSWVKHGILHRPVAHFVPGQRYDFVFGVRWSSDAHVGWVEFWVNGRRALPRTNLATLWRGQTVYAKLANYRPTGIATWPNVVYDAGFRRAVSRSAVMRCVRRA